MYDSIILIWLFNLSSVMRYVLNWVQPKAYLLNWLAWPKEKLLPSILSTTETPEIGKNNFNLDTSTR